VTDVALYFPYVNLPDDGWVKAAVLNWPQLGRIHPFGYGPLRDSDMVKRLEDELEFIVEVRPRMDQRTWVNDDVLSRVKPRYSERYLKFPLWVDTTDQIDALFYDFLDRFKDDLIPRYGTETLGVELLDTDDVYDEILPLHPQLQKVHPSKMSYHLTQQLVDAGLLVSRRYRWIGYYGENPRYMSDLAMHHRLAGVYLAILADVVARENDMTPVTDQAPLCAATSGWTIEAMAQILLEDDPYNPPEDVQDVSHAFAVLALQTVLPKDLGRVPVTRIIEARRRLLPEMMRYREFLDSLAPTFVEISGIPDPETRAAKLRNHVERNIKQPIETMEREFGRLGLQPVRAVLSLQTLAPPTVLGILANVAHLPDVVTGAGVVAGCLVAATAGALDQRKQALAGHPAGYLLNLRQELGPSDTVAQIRSAIRRARTRR